MPPVPIRRLKPHQVELLRASCTHTPAQTPPGGTPRPPPPLPLSVGKLPRDCFRWSFWDQDSTKPEHRRCRHSQRCSEPVFPPQCSSQLCARGTLLGKSGSCEPLDCSCRAHR